jgi:antitoxin component of MazEF toxin-antitoxin module
MFRYLMAREILKVRKVGGTLVVTLTQNILEQVKLVEGDRILIEAVAPGRVLISKEEAVVPNTRRTELEIEAMEARIKAIDSDIAYKHYQNLSGMACDPGMEDDSIARLAVHQLTAQRDQIAADMAQKRFELFELQGS